MIFEIIRYKDNNDGIYYERIMRKCMKWEKVFKRKCREYFEMEKKELRIIFTEWIDKNDKLKKIDWIKRKMGN